MDERRLEGAEIHPGWGCADIILLDLNVPKVDGHSVLRYSNEKGIAASVPVVVMTGSNNPADMARTKKNGASAYIIKPMTISEIDSTTEPLRKVSPQGRS